MRERGHDRDTLQSRVKVKELWKAYSMVREANHHSGAALMTSQFYKELDLILGGDRTSTAKSNVDTWVAHMPVESGLSQEEEILDEEVEGDPKADDESEVRDACSQEFFSTPEEASQSQLSEFGEVQTEEEAPGQRGQTEIHLLQPILIQISNIATSVDVVFRNTPCTSAELLRQMRKGPRCRIDDMFREVMQSSSAEKRKQKQCWEAERQDRKENHAFVKDATERIIKVMEEQTQMLKSLIELQHQQISARPSLQHIQNSFPCPPNSTHTFLSTFRDVSVSPSLHPLNKFHNESWTYTQL
ncbi:uncharacterized protein LOC122457741 isoform X1 [Dermochelys coriacea]|uniref:uncharacterized protein LOC122457741 isoform X1 n=1 Tax=Dermochelys coriacea TaxID=27794 RepID=UPI001CA80148|nr:uncharacterized protein LOC122457741 isoform X1 [Dermochelys coriacea]